MDGYYDFGSIQGSTRALDIDDFLTQAYAGGTLQFTSVKLTDVPETCGSEDSPGADIDAVCALTSISTLPIILTSFNIQSRKNRTINLHWTTSSETNNDHFIIERSQDGRHFKKIGRVKGEGTTNIKQSYNFTDRNPFDKVSYYRLKQVDYDGRFSFSDVRSIHSKIDNEKPSIYPNPVTDMLFIESADSIISVRVFNNQGRIVISSDVKDKSQYDLQSLPNGIYRVMVQTQNQVTVESIVKS